MRFFLSDASGMCLRFIAFYAIENNDKDLYKWLFELGMDANEFIHCKSMSSSTSSLDEYITQRPLQQKSSVFHHKWEKDNHYQSHVLPSLVAVAAEQNRDSWVNFFLAQSVHAEIRWHYFGR
jgi:hypothetical protein